jgi:diguanylate cyclase (GGDEF)-like protein/PAS domain S-box-containing protein
VTLSDISVGPGPAGAILEHAPDALVVFDDDGLVCSWNLQASALLGWAAGEAIGRPLVSLLAPAEEEDRGRDATAALLEAGCNADRAPLELRAKRRDGQTLDVEVKVARLPADNGDLWVAVIRDLRPSEIARLEGQDLFETAFSQAPIGIALIGLDGHWIKVNRALCDSIGWSEEELLELNFMELTHPDDLEADLTQIALLLEGRIAGYQLEKRYLKRSGQQLWAQQSVSLVRDSTGAPRHFITHIKDISGQKRAERRLRAAELEARTQRDHATAIISAMSEGYALTVDGQITLVNESLCRITGFSREELVGAELPFPFWPPEHEAEIMQLRNDVVRRRGGALDVVLMRKSGERFEAEITAQPALDQEGNLLGFVNTMRDVSVQRCEQRELERLATTDSLTGLSNRHVLQEALERELARARREGRPLALILIDVDHFKQINDLYGHPAGDAALKEVAHRLDQTIRSGEVLARLGGEEFAWLLPGTDAGGALIAADRAREAISGAAFGELGRLTISAGVGILADGLDVEQLYQLADRALYEAKQHGRDRTVYRSAALAGMGPHQPPTPDALGLGPIPGTRLAGSNAACSTSAT